MVSVEDSVFIRGSMPEVWRHFWDAEVWPRITPHVKRIDVLEEGRGHQKLRMHVHSHEKTFEMVTQRIGIEGVSITYCQLTPPPIFHDHMGVWTFTPGDDGVRVDLVHHVRIDEERARELLGTTSTDETAAAVRTMLSRNGRTTMEAVKGSIEQAH